jgi:hypothetical protein
MPQSMLAGDEVTAKVDRASRGSWTGSKILVDDSRPSLAAAAPLKGEGPERGQTISAMLSYRDLEGVHGWLARTVGMGGVPTGRDWQ